jgi:hypothetical protein
VGGILGEEDQPEWQCHPSSTLCQSMKSSPQFWDITNFLETRPLVNGMTIGFCATGTDMQGWRRRWITNGHHGNPNKDRRQQDVRQFEIQVF